MFAVQIPVYVSLASATLVEQTFPGSADPAMWHVEEQHWRACVVDVNLTSIASASCLHRVPRSDVQVLRGLEHVSGDRFASDLRPLPLAVFLSTLPQRVRDANPARRSESQRSKEDALVAELPWVEKHLKPKKPPISFPDVEEHGESSGSDAGLGSDFDMPLVAGSRDELADLRLQWEDDPLYRTEDFKLKVLGGAWTLSVHGVVADALTGLAIGEHVQTWCRTRHVPMSFRCELALYTIEHCATMVRTWCAKMQHFFNISLTKADGAPFTDADREAFVYLADFEALALAFAGHRQGLNRIRQIRRLFA